MSTRGKHRRTRGIIPRFIEWLEAHPEVAKTALKELAGRDVTAYSPDALKRLAALQALHVS